MVAASVIFPSLPPGIVPAAPRGCPGNRRPRRRPMASEWGYRSEWATRSQEASGSGRRGLPGVPLSSVTPRSRPSAAGPPPGDMRQWDGMTVMNLPPPPPPPGSGRSATSARVLALVPSGWPRSPRRRPSCGSCSATMVAGRPLPGSTTVPRDHDDGGSRDDAPPRPLPRHDEHRCRCKHPVRTPPLGSPSRSRPGTDARRRHARAAVPDRAGRGDRRPQRDRRGGGRLHLCPDEGRLPGHDLRRETSSSWRTTRPPAALGRCTSRPSSCPVPSPAPVATRS